MVMQSGDHNDNDKHNNQKKKKKAVSGKKKSAKKKTKGRVSKRYLNGMSIMEVESLVCTYFCYRKVAPAQIHEHLKKDYGIVLPQTEPFRIIRKAAENMKLRYAPLAELKYGERVRKRFKKLHEVVVVKTSMPDGVTSKAAQVMMGMIKESARSKAVAAAKALAKSKPKDKPMSKARMKALIREQIVHLGLAGGYTLRGLATHLSESIIEEFDSEVISHLPVTKNGHDPMPHRLHFHAMVSGFDLHDPTTDPNAMFTRFVFDTTIPVKTSFTALHAPGVVTAKEFETLRERDGVREAYAEREDIDIVATSLASWDDEHSKFASFMKDCPKSASQLTKAGVIGDMMWLPVGQRPIEVPTEIRAMTLMELSDLHKMIVTRDGKVLLCGGPCRCGLRKTAILQRILELDQQLVTHLVIDIETAKELLGE